jgi:mannitol-1-/sugar-/sorbitol-6-phosphatase
MRNVTIVVRAVLFDMDGVLINSIAADERSWWRWAEVHGMQETFSIRSTHGRRSVDTIRALRPDLDLATELERIEALDAEDSNGLTAYPGAHEVLASLSPNQWSIVTSASERILRHRLQALGVPLPLRRVTADLVTQGKPDPEPYRLGAAQHGLNPEDCLVIEDAPSGIRAGKAAGCRVLAVAQSHQAHELQEADWIIGSMKDLRLETNEEGRVQCSFVALS